MHKHFLWHVVILHLKITQFLTIEPLGWIHWVVDFYGIHHYNFVAITFQCFTKPWKYTNIFIIHHLHKHEQHPRGKIKVHYQEILSLFSSLIIRLYFRLQHTFSDKCKILHMHVLKCFTQVILKIYTGSLMDTCWVSRKMKRNPAYLKHLSKLHISVT